MRRKMETEALKLEHCINMADGLCEIILNHDFGSGDLSTLVSSIQNNLQVALEHLYNMKELHRERGAQEKIAA